MSLRINSNIAAMNAYRNLSSTDKAMKNSLEKLSSGLRINRAADDAAGLSISQGLQSQIGGLQVAARNAQDGINVVQTADGALNESEAILQRMRDLAVQSSNSGSQDASAQSAAQTEFTQLNSELDRIVSTTKFGSQKVLDGTYQGNFQVDSGTGAGSQITVDLGSATLGAMAPTARIAPSGGLITAVNSLMPNIPRLLIEKVAPVYSSGLSLRDRARSASSLTSPAISSSDFASAARTTGVIKPFSVATATPMSACS